MATLVCRRGVRGLCFILHHVFLSMLALEKIKLWCYCVVLIRRYHKKTADTNNSRRLPFSDLSNGRRVFDKFSQAISSQE